MKVSKKNSDIYQLLDNDGIPSWNFLFVGHWLQGNVGEDRKDIGMMIKTFCSIFKDYPKEKQPGIIMKTSTAGFSMMGREDIRIKIDNIKNQFGDKCPPIFLLFGDLRESEMNELYNHPKCKTMISFTKGEGYGRPLQEFAITGKPIIVSKWSGQMDFLPEENVVFLEGDVKPVHESAVNQFLLKESSWFTVNYSQAAQKMYHVHKNYDDYLKKSSPLTKYTEDNFSLSKMTDKLKSILEKNVRATEHVELVLPKITKL